VSLFLRKMEFDGSLTTASHRFLALLSCDSGDVVDSFLRNVGWVWKKHGITPQELTVFWATVERTPNCRNISEPAPAIWLGRGLVWSAATNLLSDQCRTDDKGRSCMCRIDHLWTSMPLSWMIRRWLISSRGISGASGSPATDCATVQTREISYWRSLWRSKQWSIRLKTAEWRPRSSKKEEKTASTQKKEKFARTR
jgi:hypothetical protein